MGTITQQPQVFTDYVARLERQNRMLNRGGFFLFLVCFLAIGSIAWQVRTMSRGTLLHAERGMISAKEFDVLDENGRTQGMLKGTKDGAMFWLNGPENTRGLAFASDPSGPAGSLLGVVSPNGEQQFVLSVSDASSALKVGATKGGQDEVDISAGGGLQSVTVSDKAGFQAVLGSASLVRPESGETRATSAASLTLFGKDGHVIWMTPKP
jgi:hypothetical protein